MQTGMRVKDMKRGPKIQQCEERFTQLVGDIFIGNELVPVSAWSALNSFVDPCCRILQFADGDINVCRT